MVADRNLQTKIGGRPNVRAPKGKKQIDFGAPPPDASNCQQFGERGFVIRLGEPGEIELAAGDGCGQIACIAHLLPAKPARAQCRVVEGEKRLGRQRAAEPDQPLVHRRRGVDRHLLLQDDVQERAKPVAAAAKPRRTGLLQDFGKGRLDRENGDPFDQALRGVDRPFGPLPDRAHRAAPANRDADCRNDLARAVRPVRPSIPIPPFAARNLMA